MKLSIYVFVRVIESCECVLRLMPIKFQALNFPWGAFLCSLFALRSLFKSDRTIKVVYYRSLCRNVLSNFVSLKFFNVPLQHPAFGFL